MSRPSAADLNLTDAQRRKLDEILCRPPEDRCQQHHEAGSDPAEPSAREIEVLRHVARGETNAEIGAVLHISAHTAQSHLAHLLAKMNARSRAHAVALGYQRGYLDILDDLAV